MYVVIFICALECNLFSVCSGFICCLRVLMFSQINQLNRFLLCSSICIYIAEIHRGVLQNIPSCFVLQINRYNTINHSGCHGNREIFCMRGVFFELQGMVPYCV